jgi:hypothetical protein
MKQMLLSWFVLCATQCLAQNSVNIFQKNGNVVSYTFDDRPKVEFAGEKLVVKVSTTTVEIPMSDVAKFTFDDSDFNETGIVNVKTGNIQSECVEVYTIGGKLVKKEKVTNGASSFSTNDLTNGTYIIKNGSTTFKFIKK